VLSRKVSKDAVLEVLVLAAAEKDIVDGLSPLPALAARSGDLWHSLGEKEVVQSDLLVAQLHQLRYNKRPSSARDAEVNPLLPAIQFMQCIQITLG
jgi:hypothetical protein